MCLANIKGDLCYLYTKGNLCCLYTYSDELAYHRRGLFVSGSAYVTTVPEKTLTHFSMLALKKNKN